MKQVPKSKTVGHWKKRAQKRSWWIIPIGWFAFLSGSLLLCIFLAATWLWQLNPFPTSFNANIKMEIDPITRVVLYGVLAAYSAPAFVEHSITEIEEDIRSGNDNEKLLAMKAVLETQRIIRQTESSYQIPQRLIEAIYDLQTDNSELLKIQNKILNANSS